MARGWESKSVESQIESAERLRRPSAPVLTPEQIAAERQRDSLLLHRTRVLRDLDNCRDERYKATLLQGLAFLEDQLKSLGWKVPAKK